MENGKSMKVWSAAILIVCICCTTGAAENNKAAESDPATVAEVRTAVKKYLTLLTQEKWEAAAESCYCANDNERAASRAWAETASEHLAGDRLAVEMMGDQAKGAFTFTALPEMIDSAQVLLVKDRAMVIVNKDVRYPLIRVKSTWRISIEGVAKLEKKRPEMMALFYLSHLDRIKQFHALLEKQKREMLAAHIDFKNAREALALEATPEQLDREPSDATPAGALHRYLANCAAGRKDAASAMCSARGELAKELIETTTLNLSAEHTLYMAAVFRFGREGAEQILSGRITPELIAQSTAEEHDNTARVTLAPRLVLPMIKIEGHWKLDLSELCRTRHITDAQLIQFNLDVAKVYYLTAKELLDGKYDSPDAVNEMMVTKGFRLRDVNAKAPALKTGNSGESATTSD
jgi:hypothetical protein